MSVTISIKREFELIGNDEENDPCLFPRDTSSHVFVQAFNFRTKLIAKSQTNYLGFPYIIKIGTSLVGIYSDGESHANSDKQIMIRSDDNGLTWSSVDFYINSTGAYNFSLLTDIVSSGSKVVFKNWTVTNTSGTFSATIQSSVINGGDTYFIWSKPVNYSGTLYRTGYTGILPTKTALLQSVDNGSTWTFKTDIFSVVGLYFTEADIVNTNGNNWIAICRTDDPLASVNNNLLYWSISNNNGTTWSTPELLPTSKINGRQPNITKLSNADIIISSGDRSGTSGYAGNGEALSFLGDTTGVTVTKLPSPTNCVTNPLSTTAIGTAKIRLTLVGHGYETDDLIFIENATGPIGGIPVSEINGFRTVTRISSNVVEFNTTTTATSVTTGGGSGVTASKLGWRTRISPMYSTDGGQPFVNEINSERVNAVFYARKTNRTKAVISSSTLDTQNL